MASWKIPDHPLQQHLVTDDSLRACQHQGHAEHGGQLAAADFVAGATKLDGDPKGLRGKRTDAGIEIVYHSFSGKSGKRIALKIGNLRTRIEKHPRGFSRDVRMEDRDTHEFF